MFWYLLSPLRMLFARHWASVSPVSQRPESCKHLSMPLTQYYGIADCRGRLKASSACHRCCTTPKVTVELNPGCFSRVTATCRLLVCLPFALRVHENFRVKSSWCIPGEKKAAKCCSVEPCSRAASHCLCHSLWGNWDSFSTELMNRPGVFHDNREAQEPWCILRAFFGSYQLGAAFVLLCSSEVPVKSHPWRASCQLSL